MNQKAELSKQIWDYIDGECSKEAHQRIGQLIKEDEVWTAEYDAIIGLNHSLESILPEQPSMRFSKNILDQLVKEKKPFIRSKGLLSIKAKLVSISVFTICLVLGLSKMPIGGFTLDITIPYHSIQKAIYTFVALLDIQIDMNIYIFLMLTILFYLGADHLLRKRIIH